MKCEFENEYGLIQCGRIPVSISSDTNLNFLPNCEVDIDKINNKDIQCLESNQNRPADAYILGNLKFYGTKVKQEEKEGLRLIDYAISNQYPEAIYWLAKQNKRSGGVDGITLKLLEQASNLGNPLAIHELGVRYLKGDGVDLNLIKASILLNKSKEFVSASYSALALIDYQNGDVQGFIEKNNIAAEKGFLFSLVDLSILYLGELSNMEGYLDLNKVNEISDQLIVNDIAVGYMVKAKALKLKYGKVKNEEICNLYKISYEKGYLDAGLSLGAEYLTGANCEKNYKDALNIFLNLFESENIEIKKLAASNLGYIYINGLGIPANVEKAKQYLKYSANLGLQPAIDMLNNIK